MLGSRGRVQVSGWGTAVVRRRGSCWFGACGWRGERPWTVGGEGGGEGDESQHRAVKIGGEESGGEEEEVFPRRRTL